MAGENKHTTHTLMGKVKLIAQKQRVACIDKEMYVLRPERYSLIDSDELIEMAAHDAGIQETQIAAAYLATVKQIEQLVLNGHSVRLGKIGILSLGVKAKAVEKKDDISVGNVKTVRLMLKPSTYLRQKIEDLSFSTVMPADGSKQAAGDDDDEDGQ